MGALLLFWFFFCIIYVVIAGTLLVLLHSTIVSNMPARRWLGILSLAPLVFPLLLLSYFLFPTVNLLPHLTIHHSDATYLTFFSIMLLLSIIGTLANYYWLRKNIAITLLQVLNIIIGGLYTGLFLGVVLKPYV